MCEYEVNWLTNEKVIRGKQNFNANVKGAGRTPTRPTSHPEGFTEKSGEKAEGTFYQVSIEYS